MARRDFFSTLLGVERQLEQAQRRALAQATGRLGRADAERTAIRARTAREELSRPSEELSGLLVDALCQADATREVVEEEHGRIEAGLQSPMTTRRLQR